MKKILFIFLTILLLISPLTASAHSGKTDSSGGHYDYSTGEYHYHHGYPAHQHINGLCPYKIDDINISDYSYDEETYYTNSSEIFPIEEKTTEFNINNLYFKSGDTVFNITINKFLMILLSSVSIWIIIYILSNVLILRNIYKKRYDEYLPNCKNISFIISSFISVWSAVISFVYEEYIFGIVLFVICFIISLKIWLNINDKLFHKEKKKAEYEKLLIYQNKTHTEIFNIINKTNIDFDISKIKENPIFTVYTTYSGQKYHKIYKCCGAVNKNFIFETTKQPCSLCCHSDNSLPITKEQYKNYKDLLKKLESNNIEIHE